MKRYAIVFHDPDTHRKVHRLAYNVLAESRREAVLQIVKQYRMKRTNWIVRATPIVEKPAT